MPAEPETARQALERELEKYEIRNGGEALVGLLRLLADHIDWSRDCK